MKGQFGLSLFVIKIFKTHENKPEVRTFFQHRNDHLQWTYPTEKKQQKEMHQNGGL